MLQVHQVNTFESWVEKMVSLDIFNLDSTSESKLDQVYYKIIAPNSFAWGEALLHHGCLSYGVASDHFDVASLEHWSGRFEKEHKQILRYLNLRCRITKGWTFWPTSASWPYSSLPKPQTLSLPKECVHLIHPFEDYFDKSLCHMQPMRLPTMRQDDWFHKQLAG